MLRMMRYCVLYRMKYLHASVTLLNGASQKIVTSSLMPVAVIPTGLRARRLTVKTGRASEGFGSDSTVGRSFEFICKCSGCFRGHLTKVARHCDAYVPVLTIRM